MKTKYILFLVIGSMFHILSYSQTVPYRSYFGAESTRWYVLNNMIVGVVELPTLC
jgi:hypothetical protein